MDIYLKISRFDLRISISIHRYPWGYPCAVFRYLHGNPVQAVDIHNGYLGSIWDIHMPSIIPEPSATDLSHGRAKSQPSESRCSVTSCQARGTARRRDGPRRRRPRSAGMGPAGAGPGAQGWAPPAPAQERRAPSIGPALCVGPVPAQAPAFTNRQGRPPLPLHLHPPPQPFPSGCFSCSEESEQPVGKAIANHADIHTDRPSSIATRLSRRSACNS